MCSILRHDTANVVYASPVGLAGRLVVSLLALLASAALAGASRAGVVAGGLLTLPAAAAFGEPGFHQVLVAAGRLRGGISGQGPFRLTISLRDLGRPGLTCSSEHPLSGCATVDWADDPSRPKVPASGVFANWLTLRLHSGERTLFFRRAGALANKHEPYTPG